MSAILLTAPAVEPVTLDEAKAYLRVEHSDDDDVIAALIAGSRIHVEAQPRRALITQSWRISADNWPEDGRLAIRPAPLQTLIASQKENYAGGRAHRMWLEVCILGQIIIIGRRLTQVNQRQAFAMGADYSYGLFRRA
jgi:uncharacterized phiE125 gp8 family phage protein